MKLILALAMICATGLTGVVLADEPATDFILSAFPSPTTAEQLARRAELVTILDKIGAIPDDEINDYPIVTDPMRVAVGKKMVLSPNYCEIARTDAANLGLQTIQAQLANSFILTLAEGIQGTGINPETEDVVPTQEMILAYKNAQRFLDCAF